MGACCTNVVKSTMWWLHHSDLISAVVASCCHWPMWLCCVHISDLSRKHSCCCCCCCCSSLSTTSRAAVWSQSVYRYNALLLHDHQPVGHNFANSTSKTSRRTTPAAQRMRSPYAQSGKKTQTTSSFTIKMQCKHTNVGEMFFTCVFLSRSSKVTSYHLI